MNSSKEYKLGGMGFASVVGTASCTLNAQLAMPQKSCRNHVVPFSSLYGSKRMEMGG